MYVQSSDAITVHLYNFDNISEDIFGDDDTAGSSSSKRVKLDENAVTVEIKWFYRLDDVTHGPFSSTEMFEMQNKRFVLLHYIV